MSEVANLLSLLLSLSSLTIATTRLFRLKALLAGTTAESAIRWAVTATVCVAFAAVLRFVLSNDFAASVTALQYAGAVMLLTPLIAILGARTPGATAWPWFVVIPLVVILQWPSLSQLAANQQSTAVEIPTPTIIGFFFILVMGAGNYFGTALTFAGLIGSTAVVVFLLPVTEWMQPDNAVAFPCGCLLLGWAAVLVTGHMKRLVPRTSAKSDDVDGLWRAFCDIYGMVWTKRVMDRVNQFAERESWDVRLSLDGFVSWPQNHDEKSFTVQPIAQAARRRIQILAWVLKRFVDEPFLRRFVSSDIPLDQAPG